MTCIAWDGKTLAADKRMRCQGLARTVTKIFRIGDSLVGISGNCSEGYDMVEWVRGWTAQDLRLLRRLIAERTPLSVTALRMGRSRRAVQSHVKEVLA